MGNNHSSTRARHGNGTMKLRNKKSKQQLMEREEIKESAKSRFHLPKNDQDIDRMQLQHFLFKHIWEDKNYSSPIEQVLKSGDCRVLDAGCGPGAWLLEMSTQHPSTKFYGIDIAAVFPSEIKPTNLNFYQCDINGGLPFEDNYFDFVRMSLMITSLKADQWVNVIRELVRVLKPGGHLELIEKELLVNNAGPHFAFMVKNIMSFIQSTGINGYITQQIPFIFSSIPSLINIRSEARIIPIGPLGGQSGLIYGELLEMYFKNKLIDVLPRFMNITEKEYLNLWERCQLEFNIHATTTKLFRFWAQKDVIDDDDDNNNNDN
ncbi:S-adenosyl-L-methionine-dependent methyltransferase [Glomus cerebriforme]|uniref:S-adenosyl-L-methionine-dependent methyltransferase n=1 Tax=Glomus cerebriforme TaxID=658196 RepID=A0A397T0A2_9GLOM|nr:S-adenosyl-L-methionine-dependent methyltransferase [Glomus cerebriforme]